jgi:hypothetical protein
MSKHSTPSLLESDDLFGGIHEDIIREADRHLAVMQDLDGGDETARYAESVIRAHDIVLGTFADPSLPAGIGAILIKGRTATQIMRETRVNNKSVTAIPCGTRDLAVQAMMMWGDGAPGNQFT